MDQRIVGGQRLELVLRRAERQPGDLRGQQWAAALSNGVLDDLANGISHLGYLPIAGTGVLIAGGLLILRRHALEGLAIWWGLILTMLALWLTKGAIWHADPSDWPTSGLVDRVATTAEGNSPTYPSAVAAYSVAWLAIAIALRHAITRLASVAAILVLAILAAAGAALAAVYLGEDWFSDAAGGLGLGVLAFSLAGTCALALDWFGQEYRALRALRAE